MLIGLHGKKRAGKDTVFARIEKLYGEYVEVERVSFADLLYASAAAALNVKVRDLQEWKADPVTVMAIQVVDKRYIRDRERTVVQELSVREYLQRYGTEAHRELLGTNFWVDQVNLYHEGKLVVVTDVRFDNEAARVREAGGSVVHVVGPDDVEGAGDTHASEAGLPPGMVDRELINIARHDHFGALDAEVDRLMDGINMSNLPNAGGARA